MAKGIHLFPSRTQQLSPYTSKVLGWKRPGRIDSCRLEKKNHTKRYGSFFYLCNYTDEQVAGLAAQPPRLKELCDAQMCKRRGVSKSMFTCFLTEKRHPICHELCDVRNREGGAFSENATEQGVFLEGQILQLWNQVGGGSFLMKYCWSREYIVSVSSNFLTQISCGIKTKCRKTRAMQRDFTIVDSLALRQCNTSMIPDTHSLKLLFPTRYTSRSIYQSSMCNSQSA